ncbi:hypothetical protein EGU77_16790, partial [Pseudomonas syringae pv. theae]|nr:hypothetical protein [Pseudomonas syringae pv. theae]
GSPFWGRFAAHRNLLKLLRPPGRSATLWASLRLAVGAMLLLILAEGRGSKLARDLPGTGSKTLYLDKVVSVKACFIIIE